VDWDSRDPGRRFACPGLQDLTPLGSQTGRVPGTIPVGCQAPFPLGAKHHSAIGIGPGGQARPGPPADPDVRISRIRLLETRFRYAISDGVHDLRSGQRIGTEETKVSFPRHRFLSRPPVKPLPPFACDLAVEDGERLVVAADAVVAVVAL